MSSRFSQLRVAIQSLIAVCGSYLLICDRACPLDTQSKIPFNVPSQPLASAIDAYSAVTGREVFYDGSLVEGYSSTSVVGVFTTDRALDILITGTNLVPRVTGLDRFSLARADILKKADSITLWLSLILLPTGGTFVISP